MVPRHSTRCRIHQVYKQYSTRQGSGGGGGGGIDDGDVFGFVCGRGGNGDDDGGRGGGHTLFGSSTVCRVFCSAVNSSGI